MLEWYNFAIKFVYLHRRRIAGNVRTTRKRIGKGRACFSCQRGFIGNATSVAPSSFRLTCNCNTHNADSRLILRGRMPPIWDVTT